MIPKTMLVHVDGSARAQERIRLAIDLATKFGAHLIGLATMGTLFVPYTGGVDLGGSYIVEMLAEMEKQAKRATAMFEAQALAAGLESFESRIADHEAASALCTHARYVDLLIIGQSEKGAAGPATPADLPQWVVLNAGRTVLIVPHSGTFTTVGQNVLVLWNASRESASAARDALPFLIKAKQVRIAVFDARSNTEGHGDEPGSDVALYLARHGVKVTVTRESSGGDVGSAALSRAADLDIDLIVMGGYGHSRLREWIMGGVTKTMLEHMTVPVLMSH